MAPVRYLRNMLYSVQKNLVSAFQDVDYLSICQLKYHFFYLKKLFFIKSALEEKYLKPKFSLS